ncbi:response regulator [Leptospira sp. GIMC2001]|uniref:response regulator n=1 Tax=Leptospira sp. GIMC2001 TaxID=1513297 RepID=UPI00234BA948|nr:response regulator [Leptospira sp. GIMC2001]WCL48523.1 response regulator [Leptospira sp. GIMC2001]
MPVEKLTKILYVEDDLDIQMIGSMALEDVGGYELKVCSSGKEALESIEQFVPDLILLDVMMPEMDGPTTLERIRTLKEFANTPVIFITAKVQSNEIQHFLNLGAIAVITKPFDPMKLASEIEEIWNKK